MVITELFVPFHVKKGRRGGDSCGIRTGKFGYNGDDVWKTAKSFLDTGHFAGK